MIRNLLTLLATFVLIALVLGGTLIYYAAIFLIARIIWTGT